MSIDKKYNLDLVVLEDDGLVAGLGEDIFLDKDIELVILEDRWSWEELEKDKIDTYLYFIEEVGTNRLKIGISKNPKKRLKELQTGNSNQLVLLGFCKGTYKDEARLHYMFKHLHIYGEWFYKSDAIMELMERLLCL